MTNKQLISEEDIKNIDTITTSIWQAVEEFNKGYVELASLAVIARMAAASPSFGWRFANLAQALIEQESGTSIPGESAALLFAQLSNKLLNGEQP